MTRKDITTHIEALHEFNLMALFVCLSCKFIKLWTEKAVEVLLHGCNNYETTCSDTAQILDKKMCSLELGCIHTFIEVSLFSYH